MQRPVSICKVVPIYLPFLLYKNIGIMITGLKNTTKLITRIR